MPRSAFLAPVCGVALGGILCMATAVVARAASRGPEDRAAAVVAAVNALVEADIPIAAAERTRCSLERLPASRDELVALVPAEHRRLITQCARGRTRMVRRRDGFDLLGMIDGGPTGRTTEAATIERFFADRPVDVATGTGLSDGPYPISFDWVVVLDPRSHTLFSFVLNCRD